FARRPGVRSLTSCRRRRRSTQRSQRIHEEASALSAFSAFSVSSPGWFHPTVNTTSFDGGLIPQTFLARTRTKYVPGGAEPVSVGEVLRKSSVPRSVRPGAEPDSRR